MINDAPFEVNEDDIHKLIVVFVDPSETGTLCMAVNTRVPDLDQEWLLRATIDLAIDELIALDRRQRAKQ